MLFTQRSARSVQSTKIWMLLFRELAICNSHLTLKSFYNKFFVVFNNLTIVYEFFLKNVSLSSSKLTKHQHI